jgi:protein-tyrosine phosphatase
MASKLPKDKFNVDSAGTGSWHIGHSLTHGLFLPPKKKTTFQNKRRQFNSNDFETYDYIYVMDKSNYDVITLAQTSEQKKQSTNYFE